MREVPSTAAEAPSIVAEASDTRQKRDSNKQNIVKVQTEIYFNNISK